jgi:hydrogenase/urease accessory protein HupE
MSVFGRAIIAFILGIGFQSAHAHEVRPAYLQIQEITANEYSVLWKVPRSFDKVLDIQPVFDNAFTLTEASEPRLLDAFMLYSYALEGPRSLVNSSLTIQKLSGTGIDVLVDIRFVEGEHHTFLMQPTSDAITIPGIPDRWEVVKSYTILGIEHILLGFDHLLFVLALLIISAGFKKLLKTITAFTLAHSITLSFSVMGVARLPGPPVEAVIALSIVFMAMEIIKVQNGKPTLTSEKPWLVAFSFGLLHGFGFAGALSEIGLPQSDIPLALATFNIGVELGQLVFVLAVILIWRLVKRYFTRLSWQRQLLPYAIGSVAAFWFIERVAGF